MKRPLRSFLLVISAATLGHAQSPDVSQLKDKLLQLEQMMQDLKQQIAQVEGNQNTPATPLVEPAAKPDKVPLAQGPIDYIGHLTMTREVANNNPEGAARIDNEEIDPSLRGYFRLPGTNTLIKLAGS